MSSGIDWRVQYLYEGNYVDWNGKFGGPLLIASELENAYRLGLNGSDFKLRVGTNQNSDATAYNYSYVNFHNFTVHSPFLSALNMYDVIVQRYENGSPTPPGVFLSRQSKETLLCSYCGEKDVLIDSLHVRIKELESEITRLEWMQRRSGTLDL
eukprot:PhF_6_TR29829/c0_g1_i1/m.43797